VKPLVRRARADEDVERAIDRLLDAGDKVVASFIDALERAYNQIERHPGSGSARYAELLDMAGLRHRRCGKFPYLVFYLEQVDRVEVWRVLHGASDLPPSLRNEAP
jgi:toxin ParE1/3/4